MKARVRGVRSKKKVLLGVLVFYCVVGAGFWKVALRKQTTRIITTSSGCTVEMPANVLLFCVDPPAPDGPSPDLNFEYDGVLVDPSVARTSTGIKVTGVADGVYGRSLLAIEVAGGQASTPAGCASEGPRFICEVGPEANQATFPFAIDVPVTGAAALSVTLTVVMEDEGQGLRDINPANNTQTLALPAR
jgi:hypothetical protein